MASFCFFKICLVYFKALLRLAFLFLIVGVRILFAFILNDSIFLRHVLFASDTLDASDEMEYFLPSDFDKISSQCKEQKGHTMYFSALVFILLAISLYSTL